MKKYSWLVVVLILVLLPTLTHACPFCQGNGAGGKKVVYAYKSITAFLALIPIGGMSGILIWLKKKSGPGQSNESESNNN